LNERRGIYQSRAAVGGAWEKARRYGNTMSESRPVNNDGRLWLKKRRGYLITAGLVLFADSR
jgi:hypothetical protein